MLLVGCASAPPPERVERDRAVLAAIQPCKERYAELLFNVNLVTVEQDGRIRYWHRGDHAVAQTYEVDQCIAEALKGVKVGPWAPGRLAKRGPATVPITNMGREILVPVRMNGVPGRMAVSTRSGLTIAAPAYAKRAGLRLVAQSPSTHARLGDKNLVVPFVRAKLLEVGDAAVEALDVVIHDPLPEQPDVDGILGSSFLSHFKMSIDRRNGRLTLAPVTPPVANLYPGKMH